MKKMIFLMIMLFSISGISVAQSASDSIVVQKVFGGYSFIKDGKPMNLKNLKLTLQNNPQAYEVFRKAQGTYFMTSMLSYAGGYLIGYPIGTMLYGGEPQWVMAGIGAGLIAIAIPIGNEFNKRALNAVDIYNSNLKKKSSSVFDEAELRLAATANGVGLVLKF
jgi:hypothetical protein